MTARARCEMDAIAWEVRLRGGTPDATELRAFAAWHDGAPEHAAAWESLQGRLARMGGAARHGDDARATAQALRSSVVERRRALRAAFGMAVVAVGGWGTWRGFHELGFDADWRSATGERGAGLLADGSSLQFDAGSRIDAATAPGGVGTALDLRQGQLLVRARGPLSVGVAGARIETSNARLGAGRLGRRGIVAVADGSALLRQPGRAAVTLPAGAVFAFDADGVAARSALSFAAASAWTRGLLVADRLPLPDLADALGRYHAGILHVTGAAARRSISGVLRLEDLDGVLRHVAGVLPVRVARYGGFVTVLS